MISPELKTKATIVLTQMRADIEKDVAEMEGQAFTGRNVAEAYGKLAAVVDGLAGILAAVIEDLPDPPEYGGL